MRQVHLEVRTLIFDDINSLNLLVNELQTYVTHFPLSQKLNERQEVVLRTELSQFLNSWESHGIPLKSYGLITFKQIITVAIVEQYTPAGGCAKDNLSRFVTSWCTKQGLCISSRALLPLISKNYMQFVPLKELKNFSPDDLIIDLSCYTWRDFYQNFMKPLKATVYFQFLK